MAVRPTMLPLINFVRRKIGDPDNGSPLFDTQAVQDSLDMARSERYNEFLKPVYTYTSGTIIVYLHHYSRYGMWEGGYTLLDNALNTVTPASDELLRDVDDEGQGAHFVFASSQFPPVRVQAGYAYDVYRVAADLLEEMNTRQAMNNIQFSSQGSSFNLNQIIQTRQQVADRFRLKQWPAQIRLVRDDGVSEAMQKRLRDVGPVSAGVPFLTGP
jgi:hypothetical protein